MSRANWRVGLPQLSQPYFMSDGRGSGGGRVVGGRPSGSSVTMANVDLLGSYSGDAKDEVYAHPLGSNNIETVRAELRTLPNVMPGYSNSKLTMLAKRLIVLVTRTPWVNHPILSSEEGYAEQWQKKIPEAAAYYFPRTIAAVDQASKLCIATFLEARCDEIYNGEVVVFMFRGCIAALPQNKHASPITALLSTMMRRPFLCEADKLSGRLKEIGQAIEGLERDQFSEVYRSLREVVGKVKDRDPRSQMQGNFLLGVCDLYFAKSGEILP